MEGKVARERISGCSVTHLEFWEIGGWRMEGERVVLESSYDNCNMILGC